MTRRVTSMGFHGSVLLVSPAESMAGDRTAAKAGSVKSLEDHRTKYLEARITELYRELGTPLRRWLLTTGLAPQEAEEVVQECFLRLYRHMHGGGGEENLRGWLYQVAHNLSVTLWKGRHRTVELTPEGWEILAQAKRDERCGPEEMFLQKEKMLLVYQIMAQMTQLQRDCLHLRMEGFRYREMAQILGVSVSTVAGSLRNAIVRLTKEYA